MPSINALPAFLVPAAARPGVFAKCLKAAEITGLRIRHGNESLRCYALAMGASVTRIIGIDPGLRRTGWGVVDSDGVRLSYVASGLVTTAADTGLAYRLRELFEGIASVIASFKPHEAAVEETFVNDNARSTLKLGQARGMALLAPAMGGLLVAEYPPNLIKKSVTGAGHAEKRQIVAMIGFLLPKARVESADEADALAIAICHANHRQARVRLTMAIAR
jgi:crossover junction endodeoxyribonuclease RuvC